VLARELQARGALVETLDGDIVRTHLPVGLGYS
jgi:adenylylsulfate kinase-like enzyme